MPKIFVGRTDIRTEPPPPTPEVAGPATSSAKAPTPTASSSRAKPKGGWESTMTPSELKSALENLSMRELVESAVDHINRCKLLASEVARLRSEAEKPTEPAVHGAGPNWVPDLSARSPVASCQRLLRSFDCSNSID